jgi:hypothetical protein
MQRPGNRDWRVSAGDGDFAIEVGRLEQPLFAPARRVPETPER